MSISNLKSEISNPAVVFTGGGTGGHLYPALALAERLRELHPASRILFIGTGRLEATKVPAAGFAFKTISVRGLTGPWDLRSVLRKLQSAALLASGTPLWQSLLILRRFRPQVVVGTGGYVCGPVILAARLLGIPSLTVEQNIRPGLTSRLLARLVDAAALVSEESITYYPKPRGIFPKLVIAAFRLRSGRRNLRNLRHPPSLKLRRTSLRIKEVGAKLVVTGNPIRREIVHATREEGRAAFGLSPDRLTLLVFGGSLGSARINRVFLESLETLADEHWFRTSVQIVHVVGRSSEFRVQSSESDNSQLTTANSQLSFAKASESRLGERAQRARLRYQAHAYLDNLPLALAAADLAICRGGGTTIAELTARGLPAIIIPWGGAANNEQYFNSRPLSAAGGAIVMQEDELTTGRLTKELRDLLQNPAKLSKMAQASRALGKPEATEKIVALIEELGGSSRSAFSVQR